MTEHRAARLSDLVEAEPFDVDLDGTSVLLVRRGEAVHALAGTCPHKGVPLSKGVVHGGRIVCAAHRAAFDLETGALAAPPACEALARYAARIEDGDVLVTVPPGAPAHPLPPMAGRGSDTRRFVIVGAGAAGWRAAETLRREGFEGRVIVLTDDDPRPYDRTDLSKGYLKPAETPADPVIREPEAIEAQGIEIRQARVVGLDPMARALTLEGEADALPYDELLIATGCEARRLDVPGMDLAGVHAIRTLADARALRDDLAARLEEGPVRVAVVGGGFVGLEAAAALGAREGVSVTVVMNEAKPLAKLFGDAFAERTLREHREAGVEFVTQARVTGLAGGGRVERIERDGGEPIPADLVLVAIGAAPRTGWLPFERGEDGGVAVGADLCVPGAPGVRLAGDIARVPTPWGEARIEHWRFAQETGELAARNMLGAGLRYEGTPFFWTMQQAPGSYAYTGHAEGWDEIRDEPPAEGGFAASYVAGGRVAAVLSLGFDDRVTRIEPRMAGRGPLPLAEAWGPDA